MAGLEKESKKVKKFYFLIFIFLLSACTPQADLPAREDDGEILGIEAAVQPVETQEEPVEPEPEEIIIEEEPTEIEVVQTEPTPAPIQEPESTPLPKSIYVAPPESEPIIVEPVQNCHPSYSGCLNPNASDYDCAGGSGNGPYYTGRVRVIGPDVFGLDRDKDGWGCE